MEESATNFQGKNVLITGASRGIGKATATAFAAVGARVGIHFNQQQAAAERLMESLAGTDHMLVQADLANPDAVARMAAQTVALFETSIRKQGIERWLTPGVPA